MLVPRALAGSAEGALQLGPSEASLRGQEELQAGWAGTAGVLAHLEVGANVRVRVRLLLLEASCV